MHRTLEGTTDPRCDILKRGSPTHEGVTHNGVGCCSRVQEVLGHDLLQIRIGPGNLQLRRSILWSEPTNLQPLNIRSRYVDRCSFPTSLTSKGVRSEEHTSE